MAVLSHVDVHTCVLTVVHMCGGPYVHMCGQKAAYSSQAGTSSRGEVSEGLCGCGAEHELGQGLGHPGHATTRKVHFSQKVSGIHVCSLYGFQMTEFDLS